MKEAEKVYLAGPDGIDRIYPPQAYRNKFTEILHNGGGQLDAVMTRARLHYSWPKMAEDVNSHVTACKTCFTHKPSKYEAGQRGLSIPIDYLSPMDLLSTDLMKITYSYA